MTTRDTSYKCVKKLQLADGGTNPLFYKWLIDIKVKINYKLGIEPQLQKNNVSRECRLVKPTATLSSGHPPYLYICATPIICNTWYVLKCIQMSQNVD